MKGKSWYQASVIRIFIGAFALILLLMCVAGNSYSQGTANPHAVMRPDWDTLAQWKEEYKNAPAAAIDNEVRSMLSAAKQGAVATSMSLLSYLDYVPQDRDQGYCGNCWVWAGTGILEIADAVQYPADRKHRHSIQFLNSCYTDAYACKGGSITVFSNWYRSEGFSIPWSNTKAYWQDYTSACGQGTSSCVSCSSIATYPSYSISFIQPETITTQGIGVGQETAIANIKNVLQQNRAVEFDFCLANTADWNTFNTWWDGQPETSLLPNVDDYCGNTVDSGKACHAVLLVGYNDDDANAANHYWILLNSWGTTAGRPNGLFRVPMVMDYDCTMVSGTPPNTVTQTTRDFWTLNTGSSSSNTLTVYKSGTGAVTSSPAGISCGATCSATFTSGTIVTLTATALSGSTFTGWSGDCTGTNSTCTLTMDRGHTVTAAFSSSSSSTLTIAKLGTNNGAGSVKSSPTGIDCGATCKYGFAPGDTVTLTATPNASSSFTGWGRDGSTCGTADACTVTVNSNMTVSAGFLSYILTASKQGTGTGTVTSDPAGINCGGKCKYGFPPGTPPGTPVTLSANPLPGSVFKGWSGDCTGTDPSCTVAMTANMTVTATFDVTCTYSAASPVTYNYNGGYKTVKLTAFNAGGGACPAPFIGIESLSSDWLSYDKVTFGNAKSNKNKGSVRIRALPYTDSHEAREGTVIIGPDTAEPFSLIVNQTGKSCTLGALSQGSASFDSAAYTDQTFGVSSAPSDCGWTVDIDPSCADCSWIGIPPGGGGAGSGTVTYNVEANGTGKSRTGKIIVVLESKPTVRKVFTIRQSNNP